MLVTSALPGNTHVTELNLSYNDALTDASAQAVLKALPDCAVRKVKLGKGVSAAAMRAVKTACTEKTLAPVRANDPSVTEIKLSFCEPPCEQRPALMQELAIQEGLLDVHNTDLLPSAGMAM